MRLINARTLLLEEFQDSNLPRYAILSHTWEDDEISFEDFPKTLSPTRKGYFKIQYACTQARRDALTHVWVDTCCIDKRSSAELQEAINSMFRYYSDADMCYAYLSDIPGECPNLEIGEIKHLEIWNHRFRESRWFTRGWTLQELIAPQDVIFFGQTWNYLAKKANIISMISTITSINGAILMHRADPSSMSVAQRMSWASHRKTTRVEDQAYSLLGIFNVSMPMLYGEGSKAFIRLQEEILKTYTDHSIFAWEFVEGSQADGSLLAPSPLNFANSGRIVQLGKPGAFEMTNRGLRIALRTIDCAPEHTDTLAILKCRYVNDLTRSLALRIRKYGGGQEYHAIKYTSSYPYNYEPHLIRRPGHPTSRLMFVRTEDIRAANEPSSLQITREFEQEASKLKFWVPMTSGDFHIVEMHPEKSWDANDGIMHSSEEQRVRGAVTIESPLGNRFVIAFGFDRLFKKVRGGGGQVREVRRGGHMYELEANERQQEIEQGTEHGQVGNGDQITDTHISNESGVQDTVEEEALDDKYAREDNDDLKNYLPGIWGSAWKSSASPHNINQVVQSSHIDCTHDNETCADLACPYMPTFTQIHEHQVTERMEARIRTERIMEDTVFRIDVSLVQMYEFEVVENRFELMGVPITAPRTHAEESSLKQLIIPSIVPPLLHELTINELQSPIQVWMRLPRAIGVSEPRPRPFRMLSHRVLFWSFQETDIVAESLLLKTPASLQLSLGSNEDVELFFAGDPGRGWEILALSPPPRDLRSHLEDLRDRIRAKEEIGKNSDRDQRLGRTISALVPLPRSNKVLRANMRCVRTLHGLACVIDLHLENLEKGSENTAGSERSPRIENKDSRQDLTVARDFNEATSGTQEIEPNTRRWGYVGPEQEPERLIDVQDMESMREAQQIGTKSLNHSKGNVDTAESGAELRDVLRHMLQTSDDAPAPFRSLRGEVRKPAEDDAETGAEKLESKSSWSSLQKSNVGDDEQAQVAAGPVQILLRLPQDVTLLDSHPSSAIEWPDNMLLWEAQDSRSAIGGVILRSGQGSEALIAFVGNETDSLDISIWKTSAYTNLAQTCASLRAKPAETWRSPFLEANIFGSQPGDASTLYLPLEKALLTAELHRTEVAGFIKYIINISLEPQEWTTDSSGSLRDRILKLARFDNFRNARA